MSRFPSRVTIGLIATFWLLGGCAPRYVISTGTPQASPHQAASPGGHRTRLLHLLYRVIGTPYRYGGDSPRTGFDCSGLVFWASHMAGYQQVPRTVREQYRALPHVHLNRLHPGDILFFHFRQGLPTHDGLYLGHGRFIHAPQTGGRVRIATLNNPFWSHHLIAAARLAR